MLGPEEFFEGLGIGLRSFFGAGVVGKPIKNIHEAASTLKIVI